MLIDISVLSVVLSLFLAILFTPHWVFSGTQHDHLIAGNPTWSFLAKEVDFQLVYVLVGSFFAIWGVLYLLGNQLFRDRGVSETERAVLYGLVAWVIAAATFGKSFPELEFRFLGFTALLWLLFRLIRTRSGDTSDRNSAYQIVAVFGGMVVTFFLALAIAMVVRTARPDVLLEGTERIHKIILRAPLFVGPLLVLVTAIRRARSERILFYFVRSLQIPLPLLLCCMFRNSYVYEGELHYQTNPIHTNILLGAVIAFLIACAIRDCFRLELDSYFSARRLIGWTSVISIGCFFVWKGGLAPILGNDYFHEAEFFLPWDQLANHGQWMYIDFIPLKGVSHVLMGMFNWLFYEGDYATLSSFSHTHAGTLYRMLLVGTTLYLLCRTIGSGWALLLSGSLSVQYFPILGYLLTALVLIRTYRYTRLFFCAWFGMLCLNFLHYPSFGVATSLAMIPFAIAKLFDLMGSGWWARLKANRSSLLFVTAFALGVVLVFCPYLLPYIRFLWGQVGANKAGFGIGFFQYQDPIPAQFVVKNRFVFEFIRFGGWGLSLVFIWYTLIRTILRWRSFPGHEAVVRFVASLISLLFFIIVLTPYLICRIDPYEFSRAGRLSWFLLGTIIPIILVWGGIDRSQMIRTTCIVGILMCCHLTLDKQLNIRSLVDRAMRVSSVDSSFIPGDSLGLRHLNGTYVSPQQFDDLKTLKYVVDCVVRRDETYLDMANTALYYYLLDKKVPGTVGSDYNIPHPNLQRDFVDKLKTQKVPLVLVGPRIAHDGGTVAFRSHFIYRWLMEQDYAYFEKGRFRFLVARDRLETLNSPHLDEVENLNRIRAVVTQRDLEWLPTSWGMSMGRLERYFETVDVPFSVKNTHNIEPVDNGKLMTILGCDPYCVWSVDRNLRGCDADFVHIRIRHLEGPKRIFSAQIFWDTEYTRFSQGNSFTFFFKSGKDLLIPLGANPTWLKSTRVRSFRLDFEQFHGTYNFAIDFIRFLKLKNPRR